MMVFNSWQYFLAMAPIDMVIDAFVNEEKLRLPVADGNVWTVVAQNRFARMVAVSSHKNHHTDIDSEEVVTIDWDSLQILPSKRYVYQLIKRYTTRLEVENSGLEDDNLASLIYYLSQSNVSNMPDPTHSCIVAYLVPLIDTCQSNTAMKQLNDGLLRIRIYPNHNDVGVCKVWEAGAALAEYVISNPKIIRGRTIVEFGAGVGLTGLVAAAFGAKFVHMTDYTTSTLENLAYNIEINKEWLHRRNIDPGIVSMVSIDESC